MTTRTSQRPIVAWLTVGLVLTAAVTAFPGVDLAVTDTISGHIRQGYPQYSDESVRAAASAYAVALSTTGLLGLAGWIVAIIAERRAARWAPWFSTICLVAGTTAALFFLLVRDTSGDTGLPAMIGWAGIAPSIAGLAATALQWRRRRSA
ncbi:hypothetical protein AB3M89_03360 [Microbacterium sp. 179-I 3D2 NHS]|uniref:hypothetical protein n=1 Tax=Microbacterium sp. 179-I 3D2 NHS TaxID=3235178 RepID=UPI00399F15F2